MSHYNYENQITSHQSHLAAQTKRSTTRSPSSTVRRASTRRLLAPSSLIVTTGSAYTDLLHGIRAEDEQVLGAGTGPEEGAVLGYGVAAGLVAARRPRPG